MAKVKIRIPRVLRKIVKEQKEVSVAGKTVAEAIEDLIRQFPELKDRIRNSEGKINNFLLVYLNMEDIRFRKEHAQAVIKDGDEISLVPAMAGG